MREVLILLIRFYRRFLSPLKPRTCRFHPTCSAYALEALKRHGAFWGSYLAVRRVLRCHPWNPGGWTLEPAPLDPLSLLLVGLSLAGGLLLKENGEHGAAS